MVCTFSTWAYKVMEKLIGITVAITMVSILLIKISLQKKEAIKIQVINKMGNTCDTSQYHWSDWNKYYICKR